MHYFEHKIKFIKIYHDLHHIHIIPTIYDAFDGSIQDTILMIIIPLHITAHSIQINTISMQDAVGSGSPSLWGGSIL